MTPRRASLLLLGLTSALAAGAWAAGASALGVATAKGRFFVNERPVASHATLLEGAVIETDAVASDLHLPEGVRLRLANLSRGRVHRDRFVLERGEGQLMRGGSYRLEAAGFSIVAEETARVRVDEKGGIQVGALFGPVQVARADGPVLATVPPGLVLHFAAQDATGSAPYWVTGCVTVVNGRYVLRDPALGLNLVLEGRDLRPFVGQRVEIQGVAARPDAGAAGQVRVLRVTRVGGACPAAASPSSSSGQTANTAARSKVKKAVIAGILVAGAAAGAAVALEEPDEQPETISR
ncbi:MAG: hypothetical protein RMK57_01625 [Bryobacterales bacterium]|nr:hypothetical protein [Bryobacteraceae bacterium]MDW8353204.1 hypothetical protein [Bryobacterales bacterium]